MTPVTDIKIHLLSSVSKRSLVPRRTTLDVPYHFEHFWREGLFEVVNTHLCVAQIRESDSFSVKDL